MPQLPQPRRKRDAKLAFKKGLLRPKVTRLHHWLCVLLRYGSLTDFGAVRMRYGQVARIANMHEMTVRYILQKFVRDGHQMLDHYRDRPRPASKLSPELVRYLTCKETLQAWAGYPLKWRLQQLWREKHVAYSQWSLALLYRKHGISYRATGYMKYSGFKVTEQERWEYARMLKSVIDGDKALIYVDESSFNAWRRINKTWAPKYNVINLPLQDSRGHGLTVYGAIGTCLKRAVFTLGESTNPEGYCAFLREVRKQFIGRADEEIYVVADGHKAHSGRLGSAYMVENNFIYLQTPGYSPQFNSIERLWSFLKAGVTRALLKFGRNAQAADFEKLVLDVLKTVSVERQRRAALLNNHRYLQQLLAARGQADGPH